ncbi:MAG: hypothetical protein IJ468_01160 [Lachnospiraceae bacterium]|nr:hypothetical protein [Lachnospiraceae bacterium]
MRRLWRLASVLSALLVMITCSTMVFARDYEMQIPYPLPGSMQSTELYQKIESGNAYVKPGLITISTNYFISVQKKSSIRATNVIAKSNTVKSTFTWNTGYGGVEQSYCLSAYPAVVGAYEDYRIKGTWSQ